MSKRVSIVNNGINETVYDADSGVIIYSSPIDDDANDAIGYLDMSGIDYKLVSYSCF